MGFTLSCGCPSHSFDLLLCVAHGTPNGHDAASGSVCVCVHNEQLEVDTVCFRGDSSESNLQTVWMLSNPAATDIACSSVAVQALGQLFPSLSRAPHPSKCGCGLSQQSLLTPQNSAVGLPATNDV